MTFTFSCFPFSIPCCRSVTQSCATLCDCMDCSMPGIPVHHQLLELAQTQIHRVGNAIQPSHPLSSPSPPVQSFPASGSFLVSQLFASGGQSMSFSLSISPLRLISFRIEWFHLFAIQGTLKSLLQHHISKASSFKSANSFVLVFLMV